QNRLPAESDDFRANGLVAEILGFLALRAAFEFFPNDGELRFTLSGHVFKLFFVGVLRFLEEEPVALPASQIMRLLEHLGDRVIRQFREDVPVFHDAFIRKRERFRRGGTFLAQLLWQLAWVADQPEESVPDGSLPPGIFVTEFIEFFGFLKPGT